MGPADRERHAPRQRLRTVAILPARIGSTRLARKVLLDETGAPLFMHSARNVERCDAVARVVVATDDGEVRAAGMGEGLEVRMTSADHVSGTDRVLEAYRALGQRFDVIVNVQADEPELPPKDLEALIEVFQDAGVQAATLCAPIVDEDEVARPDVVKVVRDTSGDALYFSRSPIPNRAHPRGGDPPADSPAGSPIVAMRHVGVYAFRPRALERFCALGPGRLEQLENLEQLRWLEAGESMRVVEIERAPPGIDTRADYDAFVARLGLLPPTSELERTESR